MQAVVGLAFSVRKWLHAQRIDAKSAKRQWWLVVVAVLASLLLCGTYMGNPSLHNLWLSQGRYRQLCNNMVAANEPLIQVFPDAVCRKQAEKISLFLQISTTFTFVSLPIAGLFIDWLGARRIYGVTISILILGNLIAIIPRFWAQFIGVLIMGAMGPCVAFALLTWAQLLPHATPWIVAFNAASFPGGAYILGSLRQAVLTKTLSISAFFAIWLCASLPAFYLFVIWPRGVGHPYAAAHPVRMLAHFELLKNIMKKLHIHIPEDAHHTTMVELEELYTNKTKELAETDIEAQAEATDEEEEKIEETVFSPPESDQFPPVISFQLDTGSESSDSSTSSEDSAKEDQNGEFSENTTNHVSESSTPLDGNEVIIIHETKPLRLKEVKWVYQLTAPSIALIQLYFLFVSVWLAVVANQGSSRLTYWARKLGGDQMGINARIAEAKAFLPWVDLINTLALVAAPFAAYILKKGGMPALSTITHLVATVSASLCLIPSFRAQIVNYYLFPIVRGLMYPFTMMFLIQVCGRRHLGLLWGLTASGASPIDLIQTLLNKYWLTHANAWVILNGIQLIPILLAWTLPIYIWIRKDKIQDPDPHSRPLA